MVRFFALHRIKPHAPPLVLASINSLEFHSCERTPQVGSFHPLSRVEPWDLTTDLKSHLQTLYAQSFWITLASFVLPQLLAQIESMLIP
ncbi:hypothetical protein Golax_004554 [Gossypium laxum]|uniref:Uncharacterized protein n=1 Tax=Gossypium laxum TaxID=34288 RepID=A0A7J9B3N1_9ROSI|nr:hypothetical protein [Gossypium laxum]